MVLIQSTKVLPFDPLPMYRERDDGNVEEHSDIKFYFSNFYNANHFEVTII